MPIGLGDGGLMGWFERDTVEGEGEGRLVSKRFSLPLHQPIDVNLQCNIIAT